MIIWGDCCGHDISKCHRDGKCCMEILDVWSEAGTTQGLAPDTRSGVDGSE